MQERGTIVCPCAIRGSAMEPEKETIMAIPYAGATSGRAALEDIRKILEGFGCDKFAPMEDFRRGEVTIPFEYRGRMVQVTASARGYARAWLRETPHTSRMKVSAKAHEDRALKQGNVAVWSILRDWIKGQIMAVECDVLKFDAAFLGQILLPDGRTVHQHVEAKGILPQIEGPK